MLNEVHQHILAFAAAALLVGTATEASAESSVVDGDTLRVDGQRVRLFGIDAPERGQPGSREATDFLRRLIAQGPVTCDQVDYDARNRRPVSLCAVRGVDLSLALVRAGHAVVWCTFVAKLRPNLLSAFRATESEARNAKRGLWARPFRSWREWGC